MAFVEEDQLVKISSFTNEELKILASYLLKDWRVYVLAGIALSIGVGLLYWQAHEQIETQINKFQTDTSNEVARAYSEATNRMAGQFDVFSQSSSNQIASAYSEVTNQISFEFQTPRIRQTVEDVAKNEAKEILKENVQPEVERFKKDADFLRLTTRARAYDFKAYQQLLEIELQTNEDAILAKQVLNEIDRSLQKDRANESQLGRRRQYMEFSGTNFYNGPFSSDEIAVKFQYIQNDKTAFNREAFINLVADANETLFLPRLIEFFTNEPDLSVADHALLAISKFANADFYPHDYKSVVQWWQTNQYNYTNWPVSEFNIGEKYYLMGVYSDAASCFSKVLSVDPAADLSRLSAIMCDFEIGETNKAAMLAKGFKRQGSRWDLLAAAKMQIESGNVSNATVQLAFIATNFPSMGISVGGYINSEPQIWRKVDWALFNKLTEH